jgi:ABC-type nickel/cobalt efflux system permease component RcnA
MAKVGNWASVCLATMIRHWIRLRADHRGSVAVMMGGLMVPMVGAMGLGFEVSNWYMTKRTPLLFVALGNCRIIKNSSTNFARRAVRYRENFMHNRADLTWLFWTKHCERTAWKGAGHSRISESS